MKRRDFIRLGGFLTASVATLGVTGCSIDGPDSEQSPFPSATPEPVRAIPTAATGASWQFPQSIASADPRPDSIILWTRVVPTGLLATDSSTVNTAIRLVVTTDDNSAAIGTNVALTTTAANTTEIINIPAYADFDNSVRHKLSGLSASKIYYYQFIAGDVLSNIGRFKTAPAATDSNDVKFIFMTCQDWSDNHWGAFDQIIADDTTPADPDVDFIVHLGDYIYETDSAAAAESSLHTAVTLPIGAALQPPSSQRSAVQLADYRYLYKLYRSDTRLQKVHERFPMVAVWDDHEFSDDCWQNAETYSNANNAMTSRRRNANQAWFEFMPADVSFSEVDPSFQNIKLYRDLKFGATMHLVMTDERLYRQDHLIPESTVNPLSCQPLGRINSRYLAPEASLKSAEIQKESGVPSLTLVSILGPTQRDWWKSTMLNSTSTWKVWGNEVSLLRMGLNGTNALAALIALGAVPTLATNIGNTATNVTGGNVPVAAAIVGAATFGATTSPSGGTAGAGATAIATLDATSGGTATPAQLIAAAMGQGQNQTQATVAVTAYLAAKLAATGGATAQVQATTAAGAIAIGTSVTYDAADVAPCIRNDIRTNKTSSPFFLAAVGGSAAAVAPFFQKFMINADQWDGYRKERTNLMNHLLDNNIKNVVAVTGDIHAFFAGDVYNEFAGEVTGITNNPLSTVCAAYPTGSTTTAVESSTSAGGTAAMVDLVTAGISSTSMFNYFKAAADGLDPTNALIGKLVYVPVTVPANGPFPSFVVYLDMLDFTLGKVLSTNTATAAGQVANQLSDQIKRKLATFGVPDASIDATTTSYVSGIAANPAFASAVGLAMQLSVLGQKTNPWLKHVDTEAQGYAVVTASTTQLQCQFKKLNPLVVATAPSASRRVLPTVATATVTAGTAAVVMS